jgi:ADP-ribose pyrophosphatase YjhB (NUDIX family)
LDDAVQLAVFRSVSLLERAEAIVSRLPVPARRRAFRVGYLALQAWWLLRRPQTSGVKVVLRRGDDVLLVRHTYGRRAEWDLPGGFINGGEAPQDAALREVAEEVGVHAERPVALGAILQRSSGRRDMVHAFAAEANADGAPLELDDGEIAQARWFAHDALPEQVTPYTRGMVARAYWDLFRP